MQGTQKNLRNRMNQFHAHMIHSPFCSNRSTPLSPRKLYLVIVSLLVSSSIFGQADLYVKPGGTGVNGTSWADAFGDLQQAINAASAGEEIWVAAGTYIPQADKTGNFNPSDSKTKTFFVDKNLKIYGGFAGNETVLSERAWNANITTLSGNNGSVYQIMNIERISLDISDACIIDGFIFEEGDADGAVPFNVAGALQIKANGEVASPLISHCIFRNNNAISSGAIFNDGPGGECSPKIFNCLFYNNVSMFGGAVYNHGFGSGNSSPIIVNCTFVDNTPQAIVNDARSSGTSDPQIHNSVFYNNTIDNFEANGHMTHSAYEGATLPAGMTMSMILLSTDPLFADYANKDFTISSLSPCLNQGDNTQNMDVKDLLNMDRIQDVTIDMGSYEFGGCAMLNTRLYVDHTQTTMSQTGESWNHAITNLQDAISLACACSIEEIWVAKGTYVPTQDKFGVVAPVDPRTKTFHIQNDVKILGGFAGGETSSDQRDILSNPTYLDGDLNADDDANIPIEDLNTHSSRDDNAYNVIHIDATGIDKSITENCVLDGFYIINGAGGAHGGGLLVDATGGFPSVFNNATPNILNCIFYRNSSTNGGALANIGERGNASPTIYSSDFDSNLAIDGGAIYNFGHRAGGTSNPNIYICVFRNNICTDAGGAIWNVAEDVGVTGAQCKPVINRCEFIQNKAIGAGSEGGAIFCQSKVGADLDAKVMNSIFIENESIFGGAIGCAEGNVNILNCSFANNEAGGTISFNGHAISNIAGTTDIVNSAFWNNGNANDQTFISATMPGGTTISKSILQDGTPGNGSITYNTNVTGSDNMDVNPLFVNDNADLRLQATSTGIDMGMNGIAGDLDLAGSPRKINGTIDIGAYEDYPCLNTMNIDDDIGISGGVTVTYLADKIINANITIMDNSTVTFDADMEINLNQGFEIELGCIFIVLLDGCGTE